MRAVAMGLVVLAGLCAVLVSGYYLLLDWASLSAYHGKFDEAALGSADMRTLFILEARQNIFRINCFAEGVGVLLGAILTAIGLTGYLGQAKATAAPPRIILGTLPKNGAETSGEIRVASAS